MISAALSIVLLGVASQVPSRPEGFLATPRSGKAMGVLVLHPWWGLNEDVKTYCRRLAKEGYVAFAPDLYSGKIATTIPQAEALVKTFEPKHVELEEKIAKATKWLYTRTGKPIGVIGFSFGAYYALHLSNADPLRVRKVVVYYGTGHEEFNKSKASYLGHFAEKDPYEPEASVKNLEGILQRAKRPVSLYIYQNVGHWFAEPSRKDAYDRLAAITAWKHTLAFLKELN